MLLRLRYPTARLRATTPRLRHSYVFSRNASSTTPPSSQTPPPPGSQQPKPTSQHINIYREFGRPFAKVFLMGMFTYQTLYWAWLAMEKDETVRETNEKVRKMEDEVRRLAGIPKPSGEGKT